MRFAIQPLIRFVHLSNEDAPYINLRDGFAITKAARTPSEVRGGCFYTGTIEGYAPNHRVRLYRRLTPLTLQW